MLRTFAFAALISAVPTIIPAEVWPTVRPGKVLRTPNWGDYNVYPFAARRKGQEGRVLPDLLIGADGRPQACRILESSRYAELDAGTCELMMKMSFEPAEDETGRAIPSHYSRPIIWELNDARPFASSRLKSEVRIEGGRLRECTVISGDGPYVAFWSAHACTTYRDVGYFFGARAAESHSAVIEMRLSAGDGASFLDQPWASGTLIARERLNFKINGSGDASECSAPESYGFGARDLNNLSPCGKLLTILWFENGKDRKAVRNGLVETRVVLTDADGR